MATPKTPEQADAIARVRAEVGLLMGRYSRRLKTAAEDIAMAAMLADPNANPEEVGREAFARAGVTTGLIADDKARPALTPPR